MKKILNRRYDLQGNEFSRVLKISLFSKFLPIGNLRGGPGVRCLLILSLLHYFGGLLYLAEAKYGHRLGVFKRAINKLRAG